MSRLLLSTTYFGPVQWYQKLHRSDAVCIDGTEFFHKQTYRNRCYIASTQGVQALSVPLEHAGASGEAYSAPKIWEMRLSEHGKWRREHWNALQSAYGDSPFFDYYADDLRPFFEKKWEFLYDFNMEITLKMCELLDIQPHFVEQKDEMMDDYRQAINPKHPLPDAEFSPEPYYQVYRQKHGFLPNLSILDLLFNMGNEAIFYL